MNLYGLLKKCSWLVIACASVAVGLKLVGVDLESMLHLQSMDIELRYLVGVCGLGSIVDLLVMSLMSNGCDCKSK